MKLLIFFIFFIFNTLLSEEFLYPIAKTESPENPQIYVIYQKNIQHLELWSVDPNTEIATKLLMSNFTPAGVKLLPNKSGFSFIDNGRIKLKKNGKVEPTSFEFEHPVYDFHTLEWLNEKLCYFSAKAGKRFCIFLCNTNTKSTKTLIEAKFFSRTNDDFMYPQIINNKIFFISKSGHKLADSNYESFDNYKILCTDFNKNSQITDRNFEVILRKGPKPIAFLRMISEKEGFFIKHPNKISKHKKHINLKYCYLNKNNDEWEYEELFNFKVPLKFLISNSESRIYESILPFLPKHEDLDIFYPHATDENTTNIFCYNYLNKTKTQLTNSCWPTTFFSPIKISNKLFFGGSINENCQLFIDHAEKIKCKLSCLEPI